MIPKRIHYCWFGRGPMPELALKCIESWHKYMPDYEYKLWNEDNFDINSVPYVKEAYESKKYAFVTDYVRLYALYTEGGIYMDTDVEVLKPYDDLLDLCGFTGYEGSKYLPPVTGTMASEAGNSWVKEQLDAYDGIHFLLEDGTMDTTTNTTRISDIMKRGGFVQNGKKQVYKDMHIFPVEYFCPRQTTGEYFLTENTYCDHHFMGSWEGKKRNNILKRVFGQNNLTRLIKLKRLLLG
ncbi:MAG: glycosyl transferase [Bacteroidales bacterium]|nr:glycosyl transferase [Bacteroidales bacterium]